MHQDTTEQSLQHLHRNIILRLAAALGNLRLLAVGAPFAAELASLAEQEVSAALTSARLAEQLRTKTAGHLDRPDEGVC
jgi:hypothetical protein